MTDKILRIEDIQSSPADPIRVWQSESHDTSLLSGRVAKESVRSTKTNKNALEAIGLLYGKESKEYLTTKAFCLIAPFIDRISISQLGDPKPGTSWADANYKAAKGLLETIKDIKRSNEFNTLKDLHMWKIFDYLETLPWESDPKAFTEIGQKIDLITMEAKKNNEPMIYMYGGDDYANSGRSPDSPIIFWSAGAYLLLPVPNDISTKIDEMSAEVWAKVKSNFGLNKDNKIELPTIASFFSVLTAGQEHISPIIAQSMEINGIEMFINRFSKVKQVWQAVEKMSGLKFGKEAIWLQIQLFLAHEYGHLAVDELKTAQLHGTAEVEEQLTDFQASGSLLKDHPSQEAVQVVLCENLYNLLAANPNSGDKFASYEETARVTVNALFESGLVGLDMKNGKVAYEVSQVNIENFIGEMMNLHRGLSKAEKSTTEKATTKNLIPEAEFLYQALSKLAGLL